MNKKRFNLVIFVLIAILLASGIAFAAKKLTSDAISFTIDTIKESSVKNMDQLTLVNGGVSGLKKYLVLNKKNTSYLIDLTAQINPSDRVNRLKEYLSMAVSENPSLNKDELLYAVLDGIVNSLDDQFSVYLTAKDYAHLMEEMQGGNFGGLGVYIELDPNNDKALTIIRPLDGSPAYKAGLTSGDVITKIDGKSTKNMSIDEAKEMLRGKEGTKVTVTIFRKKENKTFDIVITREIIHTKSVDYKLMDGGIAYIRIDIFGETTSDEIENALNYFDDKKVKSYIIDLRDNGGGFIDAADSICSKFMPSNSLITSVKGRSGDEIKHISFPNTRDILPVVVLINQFSASASEITAGALKSVNATLVGEKSYGKATIQKIIIYPDISALKLTVAYYYTPDGKNINKVGIEPDIAVKMDTHNENTDKDIQLQKALEVLKNKASGQ